MKLRQKVFAWILSCLILCSAFGCATVPFTGRKQLVLIPYVELRTLSYDNYRTILSKAKLSLDGHKTRLVRDVGRNISYAAEKFLYEAGKGDLVHQFDWEFTLIEDDNTVNAFALPGGKVAVYTGILEYTQDEAGLAVVIGHEIAHVIANHGGERLSQMMLAQFGHSQLAMALKTKPDTTQQFWMLAYGLGMNLGAILPYSRLHEKEADRIGLIIMARAGYDPNRAVTFWQKMKEQSKGGRNMLEFLSTHPAPDTRIEEIRTAIPEAMQYYGRDKENY